MAFVTIIGMALVTYLTRIGGLLLLERARLSPWVEDWLRHIPGAVLVSIVAPVVLAFSGAELIAGGAALLAAVLTRCLPLAMLAGVAAVVLARQFIC